MSTDNKTTKTATKDDMQLNQQIFHNLLEIVELYPQYTTAQHLYFISRRKSDSGPQIYDWSLKELLNRIEQHKEDLQKAASDPDVFFGDLAD